MFSSDVASGKKANDCITFVSSDFEKSGIEDIADIEFSFHIFDSESWDDYLDTDIIHIKTSISENYEYNFNHIGELVYEGNDVRIILKDLIEDGFLGPSIELYIENNSDKNITVQTRDVSINGFMVTAMLSSDITPGKRIVDEISFMSSELEENDIQKVEDVELIFDGCIPSDGYIDLSHENQELGIQIMAKNNVPRKVMDEYDCCAYHFCDPTTSKYFEPGVYMFEKGTVIGVGIVRQKDKQRLMQSPQN